MIGRSVRSTVGLTCGSFDYIIHAGHILFLQTCRKLCDHLVVAVVPDEVIRNNKNRNPYFEQERRMRNLVRTGLVKECICSSLIPSFIPDIYIIGQDQNANVWTQNITNFYFRARLIPIVSTFEPGITSTTDLLKRIGYLKGEVKDEKA